MNGMQLFDMHSHILPGIDDGAKTVEDSLELLSCLKNQGVTNVCLTPHFYTNEISLEDFIAERAEKFEKFKPHIPNGMNIVLGTEVYVTKYLFNNENIKGITTEIQTIFSLSFRIMQHFRTIRMKCSTGL